MPTTRVETRPADAVAVSDLYASLGLLAAIVLLALVGLALQGNWPKVLRVSSAAVAYGAVLLLAVRRGPPRYLAFVTAGAAAGLVSGVVRPVVDARVAAVHCLAGALLLGGLHWVALRTWRRLRAALTPGRLPD